MQYGGISLALSDIVKHKCRAPPKFKGDQNKDIKDRNITTITQLILFCNKAHYTKNDNYALEEVLKEGYGDSTKNKRQALRRGKQ